MTVDEKEILRVTTRPDEQPFDKIGIAHIGERIIFEGIELFDSQQMISRF